jgi:hypothetical protein
MKVLQIRIFLTPLKPLITRWAENPKVDHRPLVGGILRPSEEPREPVVAKAVVTSPSAGIAKAVAGEGECRL